MTNADKKPKGGEGLNEGREEYVAKGKRKKIRPLHHKSERVKDPRPVPTRKKRWEEPVGN